MFFSSSLKIKANVCSKSIFDGNQLLQKYLITDEEEKYIKHLFLYIIIKHDYNH